MLSSNKEVTPAVQAGVEGQEFGFCQAVCGVDGIAGVSRFHSHCLGAGRGRLDAHSLLNNKRIDVRR